MRNYRNVWECDGSYLQILVYGSWINPDRFVEDMGVPYIGRYPGVLVGYQLCFNGIRGSGDNSYGYANLHTMSANPYTEGVVYEVDADYAEAIHFNLLARFGESLQWILHRSDRAGRTKRHQRLLDPAADLLETTFFNKLRVYFLNPEYAAGAEVAIPPKLSVIQDIFYGFGRGGYGASTLHNMFTANYQSTLLHLTGPDSLPIKMRVVRKSLTANPNIRLPNAPKKMVADLLEYYDSKKGIIGRWYGDTPAIQALRELPNLILIDTLSEISANWREKLPTHRWGHYLYYLDILTKEILQMLDDEIISPVEQALLAMSPQPRY